MKVQRVKKSQDTLFFFNWSIVDVQYYMFSSVQSLSHVRLFATLWTAAHQTSPSFTVFLSLIKLVSIELVMPSNHLILCRFLFLLPTIFPSIRVFSNESTLRIWRPKYWRFSTSLSNAYSGLIPLGLTGVISLLSKGLSRVFSSTTIRKPQFFSAQPSSHSRWNLNSPTRDQTLAPWSGSCGRFCFLGLQNHCGLWL